MKSTSAWRELHPERREEENEASEDISVSHCRYEGEYSQRPLEESRVGTESSTQKWPVDLGHERRRVGSKRRGPRGRELRELRRQGYTGMRSWGKGNPRPGEASEGKQGEKS